MSLTHVFPGRSLKVAYWNAEPRIVDGDRANLERHLAQLGTVSVSEVRSLEEAEQVAPDLLTVAAQAIAEVQFPQWLRGLRKRVRDRRGIWTPALVLANMPFSVLNEVMPDAIRENWYFDIMAPAHMASLPIRVANLLRIHDHLHELRRYADAVEEVSSQVQGLERRIQSMRKIDPKGDE